MLGMTKKVILADTLGNVVNAGFAISSELHTLDILVVMLAYTFQIHFDFSGYSDVAIGMGRMLGFHFIENSGIIFTSH